MPPNKKGIETIRQLVEHALSKNVLLAFENVDKESLKYTFKNFNSQEIGFCYDVGPTIYIMQTKTY